MVVDAAPSSSKVVSFAEKVRLETSKSVTRGSSRRVSKCASPRLTPLHTSSPSVQLFGKIWHLEGVSIWYCMNCDRMWHWTSKRDCVSQPHPRLRRQRMKLQSWTCGHENMGGGGPRSLPVMQKLPPRPGKSISNRSFIYPILGIV